MADTAGNVIRFIFFLLDTMVYWLIDQVYWLFTLLSQATLFTTAQINSFSSRIYVLITIIMMFKLGFSFITYIVNPDTLSDKQKGGGKLIQNIVVTIALLASVPTIFNEAYYLQNIIFTNKIIDKILLGDIPTSDEADKTKMLSIYTFMSFYRPTSKVAECQAYQGIAISQACADKIDELDEAGKNPGKMYKNALLEGKLGYILEGESINSTGIFASTTNGTFYQTERHYLFDYYYFVSTIVGGFLAFILLGFCLDLAVRSVKLGFLQLIAPIPILLSLSPQQKNNTLNNWGKECISTWASLFIRIGIVSFAINLIILINTGGGVFSFVSGGQNNYAIVTVFITIGILLFAKEFPKLIEDILGIKGAGKMTFNPLKKINENPMAAAAIGGAIGAARGTIGNAWKLGSTIREKGLVDAFTDGESGWKGFRNTMQNLGSGVAGGVSGAFNSARESAKSKDFMKGQSSGTKTAAANRDRRDDLNKIEYGPVARGVDSLRSTHGIKTRAEKEIKQIDQVMKGRAAYQDTYAKANASDPDFANIVGAAETITESDGSFYGYKDFNGHFKRAQDAAGHDIAVGSSGHDAYIQSKIDAYNDGKRKSKWEKAARETEKKAK